MLFILQRKLSLPFGVYHCYTIESQALALALALPLPLRLEHWYSPHWCWHTLYNKLTAIVELDKFAINGEICQTHFKLSDEISS